MYELPKSKDTLFQAKRIVTTLARPVIWGLVLCMFSRQR